MVVRMLSYARIGMGLALALVIGTITMIGSPGSGYATTASGPTASVGQACPKANESGAEQASREAIDRITLVRTTQCVAGKGRRTRGGGRTTGVSFAQCITEPRARQPGATYRLSECKGSTKTMQAEAVAQARAIAQLNAAGVYGDSAPTGGITPNLQWETTLPSGGEPDLLLYDRNDPSGPVGLGELKPPQMAAPLPPPGSSGTTSVSTALHSCPTG